MSSAWFALTVLLCEVTLRVIVFKGEKWLLAEDLAKLFGYSSLQSLLDDRLFDFTARVKIDGRGHARRIYREEAVRFFCERAAHHSVRPRPGADALVQWLDAGGMKIDHQPPVPEVETLAVEEIELLPPPRHVPSLRLVPRGPDPMQQLLEREKAYCRDLVKTFLRYCESEEVDKLTGMVDGQVDLLLETRYCPGLNAARYELYRKYWMQGGLV